MSSDARGLLFIVSAPSGAGKTTLVERLVDETPRLTMSRSYTSRAIREGERDGVDYNFVSRFRFEAMVADTEAILATGSDVVLVIDVQGARQVRRRDTEACTIFVMPPSLAVLEQRLRGRSKDDEGAIRRRLDTARREVAQFVDYDFLVINDELTAAVDRLRSIVVAERARLRRMRATARAIVATFQ
jgi:guanylate kinase